ncbi:MAG: PH domain-containing protein [Flavobacteriales bacterium]|nr:PH domain-containing protein [Flavobacteriales bacterium]
MDNLKTSSYQSIKNVCQSYKHWSSYFLPIVVIFITLILVLSFNKLIFWGSVLIFFSLTKILSNRTTKWILTKNELIIKSGFLPWKKTYFEVPVDDIFEAYYNQGFFGTILGYGNLAIRRKDGTTTGFSTSKMVNYKQMTQELNSRVKLIKKETASKQTIFVSNNNNSVSDEIYKLKELLDKNIITDHEFNSQKEKLLQSNHTLS